MTWKIIGSFGYEDVAHAGVQWRVGSGRGLSRCRQMPSDFWLPVLKLRMTAWGEGEGGAMAACHHLCRLPHTNNAPVQACHVYKRPFTIRSVRSFRNQVLEE